MRFGVNIASGLWGLLSLHHGVIPRLENSFDTEAKSHFLVGSSLNETQATLIHHDFIFSRQYNKGVVIYFITS